MHIKDSSAPLFQILPLDCGVGCRAYDLGFLLLRYSYRGISRDYLGIGEEEIETSDYSVPLGEFLVSGGFDGC